MKTENIDWILKNHQTVMNELVNNHSPLDLAELVLNNSRWNDQKVEKLRRRIELREGLLEIEKKKRKEVEAKNPKKTKELDEEENSRLMDEKARRTEERSREKKRIEELNLPDDDFEFQEVQEDEKNKFF